MDDFNTIQKDLFKSIILSRGGSKGFVEELGDLLNLKKSACNNRIRGATHLTMSELFIITKKYPISLDQFVDSKSHPISFTCDAIRQMPVQINDYLINIDQHFNLITHAKNINFIYFADEVPIFHFMHFPVLFYFKLFVWNYMSWKIPDYMDHFDIDAFSTNEPLNETITHLKEAYYRYPGSEVWNVRMLDLSLDQLKYFIVSGAIKNRSDALSIFNAINNLCIHLEHIAQTGFKFATDEALKDEPLGEATIYLNEIKKGADIIMVKTSQIKIIYSTFDSPNFIKTQNPRFIAYTQDFLGKVFQSSSVISGNGERDRKNAFKRIRKKIDAAEKEIKGLLDYMF